MKINLYILKNIGKSVGFISLIFCVLLIISVLNNGYGATNINVYPQTSTRWTGSVTAGGSISTSSVMYTKGGGNDRAWMKFDLSGIPSGSIINSVTLKYYITNMYNPSLQFRKVTGDPVTLAGSTLWTQIGSGTIYFSTSLNSIGWNTRVLNAAAKTDIQNAVGAGWCAIGMYCTDGSSYFYSYADGWNQSNKPYLIINYTSTLNNDIALDSITSPTNFACEGNLPIKIKMTNASYTTPISSVTITWSINSVAQTPINWIGSLAVGASTVVTLNPAFTFNPGNYIINVVLANPNNVSDPFTANNSKTVLLQITPKPSIYMQPTDQSIGVGGDALFSTVGAGGNITYQWQVSTNGGLTFTNLTNFGPYTNVTSQNMNITAAAQNMNGYLYRCYISGTCPPPVITDTVMLSVGPPVNVKIGHSYACVNGITTIPIIVKDAISTLGMKFTILFTAGNINYNSIVYTNPLLSGNGTFTVTPAAGMITVLWTGVSTVNLPNDTICKLNFQYTSNSTLVFDTVTPGNCKVSGTGGAAFPTHYVNGALTTAAPTIVLQPDNKLIITGQTGFFRVSYTGTPAFQWQVSLDAGTSWGNLINNLTYSGVFEDTLWVSPTLAMNGYRYRCVLNSCGSTVYSSGAIMNVMKLVRTWVDTTYSCTCYTPPLDILVPIKVANFDSINSISLSIMCKTTALQYNGYQNVNPALQFPIINPSYLAGNITMIRLASFATTGFMAIPDNGILVNLKFKVLCDSSKLQWETWNPGACQYSTGPDTAIYVFDAEFKNGYVMDGGPAISTNPVDQTVFAGGVATFTCSGMTKNSTLTYQWQVSTDGGASYIDITNGAIYSGAQSNTLTVNASSTSMNGYKYRCKLNGLCDQQITTAALLTVNAPPIYVTIPTIISCQGDTITVPINVQNFAAVCSTSLKLQFDNTKLAYSGFSEFNTGLSGTPVVGAVGNTVSMAWTSLTPGTIVGTGTFIKLKFTVLANQLFINSPLTWLTVPAGNCQITNCSAVTINANYSNSTVSVNPIPIIHNVITLLPASGHFCLGDLGAQVSVDITQTGVNYALYRDGVLVSGYGAVPGTGFGITFNTFNVPGVYTVRAFYPVTGCSVAMDGFVTITVDAPPILYPVTGTGSYCTGGSGLPVGLLNSQVGVDYFLYLDGVIQDTLPGTGLPLNFGTMTTAGTYTIMGRNAIYETCPTTMTGNAIITINPYPAAAGAISGPTSVCQGGTGYNFTVGAISNATSYSWSPPPGFTIVGGSGTSTITVNISNSATSGTITVRGTNSCGDGALSSFPVTVNPLPLAAGTITGTNPVCQGATSVTYTVPPVTNATSYVWTLPPGFTAVNTTTTIPSITVNVSLLAASGNITVIGHNTCGDGTLSTLALTVNPFPGNGISITGPSNPCQGATITYSTPPIANATGGYVWAGWPIGTTGTSTTNSITVTFPTNAISANISVTGTNGCGSGNPATLALTFAPLPNGAGVIGTGPADVCKGSTYTYTVSSIIGATSYIWSQPFGFTGSSTTNSITYNIAANAVSGNITVKGHNNCGDGVVSSKAILVHDLPVLTLPPFPTLCKDGGDYTLGGGLPIGGTYSGPGVSGGGFNPILAGVGTHTITYTYADAFGCVGTTTQPITVVDKPKITGTVTYDNTALTRLGNIKIYLKDSANTTILDQTLTSAFSPYGDYSFKCLTASTNYNLACEVPIAFPRPWPTSGAVNAADALKIMRYSVGLDTLSLFRRKAGDVNGNGAVNAVDALLVTKRFVQMINSFPVGDWLFNPYLFNPVVVGSTSVTRNILALVYGDVNGSYSPSNIKKSPSIFLEHSGSTNLNELETTKIPFYVNTPISAGSVSLAINYPSADIDIIDIKSNLKGFLYNIVDGQLRFAWYNLQSFNFKKGDPLFVLTVRVKNILTPIENINFEIEPFSVISNELAEDYEKVDLVVPEVKISSISSDIKVRNNKFYLGANQPNPFSNITEINYYLPENGLVHFSIMNILGEEVKVIVNEQQTAGQYKVRIEGDGLTAGMYLYKLELKGVGQHYLQSRSMIVMD